MKNFYTSKQFFWVVLGLVSATAGLLSLRIGLRQSVWFDEAYSILLARHSFGEIVSLTAQDVHPPVYYWLLKAWTLLFGSSELALRSLSVLFLAASIFMAGLLVRRLFDIKTAVIALPFLVFAPFLVRYGFEIRMYALCSFLGVAATYVLVAAMEEKRHRRRWQLFLIYALLVALGVYTLYFMVLVWIAHLAWLAWVVYRERRFDLAKSGVVAYTLAFLLFLPWLPTFVSKAGGGTLSAVTSELGFEGLYGVLTFMFLYQPSWDTSFFAVVTVIFILAAVSYLGVVAFISATTKQRRSLMLLAAYFLVPIFVLIAVTHIKPVYLERYIAQFAVAGYACVGVLVAVASRSSSWAPRILGVGLIAVLLVGLINLADYGNYNFQRVHTPSVKEAAQLLADCKEGAIIFADGPQIALELQYYITDCPIYFFNETLAMGGGFAMLSGSPLRVASASELPRASEVLHIYYNKPKNTLPPIYMREGVTTKEKLSVAVYQAASS